MEFGPHIVFIGIAALLTGAINAVAGGGMLLTFPLLGAVGVLMVTAGVTNTVALSPAYLGGILAQPKDLRRHLKLLGLLLPAAALGGIAGAMLLLRTEEKVFRATVPFMIFGASLLLAFQERLRGWVSRRGLAEKSIVLAALGVGAIALACMYGGYFGAGLSIIVLCVLGVMLDESLTSLNVVKLAISFTSQVAAALFFIFSTKMIWVVVLVMAVAALIGGHLGGRLVTRIKPSTLRAYVVGVGFAVGTAYLVPQEAYAHVLAFLDLKIG